MINEISIGEIIRINGEEWLLILTKIGNCDKFKLFRPDLISLDGILKGINRKSYFKRFEGKIESDPRAHITRKDKKKFKLLKLTNLKGGEKRGDV